MYFVRYEWLIPGLPSESCPSYAYGLVQWPMIIRQRRLKIHHVMNFTFCCSAALSLEMRSRSRRRSATRFASSAYYRRQVSHQAQSVEEQIVHLSLIFFHSFDLQVFIQVLSDLLQLVLGLRSSFAGTRELILRGRLRHVRSLGVGDKFGISPFGRPFGRGRYPVAEIRGLRRVGP